LLEQTAALGAVGAPAQKSLSRNPGFDRAFATIPAIKLQCGPGDSRITLRQAISVFRSIVGQRQIVGFGSGNKRSDYAIKDIYT
jgi:hypothetical protein